MLVSKLETLRHRFHLPYRGGQYKEDKYIKNYKTLKEYYNKNRKPMCLFLLHYYSFCHIIRFTKGKFDTAIGTNILNNQVKKKIINFDLFDRSVKILNKNYLEIDYSKLSEDDFVYFDPPYFGSMAVYNEGAKERSWTLEEDLLLRKLCDELTKRKIKWGMSNVFLNKGMKSAALKKWALCNKYEIIHFSIKYRSKHLTSGDKESTDEVFICNYKPRYGLFS
jgi:site-specific DNA-adenine methylase